MNYFLKRTKQGFTLVETLVAIAVLMISIAGPLTIANKALTSALYAKDQSIASHLAQESMEILKNKRDNLVYNFNPVFGWQYFTTNAYDSCPSSPSLNNCDAGMNGSSIDITTSCSGCQIYLDPTYGYIHNSVGTPTPTIFSRYFYLSRIDQNDYQVTVVVTWNEGTTPNELRLRSELVNNIRQ